MKIVRKSAAREGRTPPWPENGRPSVLEFGPSLGNLRFEIILPSRAEINLVREGPLQRFKKLFEIFENFYQPFAGWFLNWPWLAIKLSEGSAPVWAWIFQPAWQLGKMNACVWAADACSSWMGKAARLACLCESGWRPLSGVGQDSKYECVRCPRRTAPPPPGLGLSLTECPGGRVMLARSLSRPNLRSEPA